MTRNSFVVMGTAGAGKSEIGAALADALGLRFVEGDQFHPPSNVALMSEGTPLTDEDRRGWLLALARELRLARARGEGVVMTCSALKRCYRELLRDGDAAIQFIFLQGDTPLLRSRLDARGGHFMPSSLLDSQIATLEAPGVDEGAWVYDVRETPRTIVSAITERVSSASSERDV